MSRCFDHFDADFAKFKDLSFLYVQECSRKFFYKAFIRIIIDILYAVSQAVPPERDTDKLPIQVMVFSVQIYLLLLSSSIGVIPVPVRTYDLIRLMKRLFDKSFKITDAIAGIDQKTFILARYVIHADITTSFDAPYVLCDLFF